MASMMLERKFQLPVSVVDSGHGLLSRRRPLNDFVPLCPKGRFVDYIQMVCGCELTKRILRVILLKVDIEVHVPF